MSHVEPDFKNAESVQNAGVLLAIPALIASGLFKHSSKYFSLPNGYYGLESVFFTLAFMALCRVKNIESLRYKSPGEWGKLIGLDRIPEAKTLRRHVKELSSNETDVTKWGSDLATTWLGELEDLDYTLYIDGHKRVYYGQKTKIPKKYVARQKLCLRATTDYWNVRYLRAFL